MADIGALMVLTFGKWLAPLLITCHTWNHTQWNLSKDENQDENQDESLIQMAFPSL